MSLYLSFRENKREEGGRVLKYLPWICDTL